MKQRINQTVFWLPVAALVLCIPISPAFLAAQTKSSSAKVDTAAQKVNLNTATEKELDSLPGVGTVTAKKIISGRPYSAVEDLTKAGISASTIKKITPLVTVGGSSTGASAPAEPPKSKAAKTNPASSSSSANPPPPSTSAPANTSSSRGSPGAGQVWVNLDSGVYHYENSRYYGKTKNGKYMPEDDAIKAGYRAAKNEKKPQ